jgi:hypothetical protein
MNMQPEGKYALTLLNIASKFEIQHADPQDISSACFLTALSLFQSQKFHQACEFLDKSKVNLPTWNHLDVFKANQGYKSHRDMEDGVATFRYTFRKFQNTAGAQIAFPRLPNL